jgi:hypothetical protein
MLCYEVMVSDLMNHCVAVYSAADLSFRRLIGKRGAGRVGCQSPYGIATHGSEVFVADCSQSRVLCFSAAGEFARFVGGELRHPRGLAIVPAPCPARARLCAACEGRVVVMTLRGFRLQVVAMEPAAPSLWGLWASAALLVAADDQRHTLHVLACAAEAAGLPVAVGVPVGAPHSTFAYT